MKAGKLPSMIALVGLLALMVSCAPPAVPTPTPTKPPASPVAIPTPPPPPPTPAPPTPTPAPPTPTPKPVTVRYGAAGSASDGGIYIAIEKGYFKEQGVDLQWVRFQSGANSFAPLSAEQIEITGGGINTGLLNAIDRGVALKIVADKSTSRKGFDSVWITARKDLVDSGQIKEVKDLKGKKFGVASVKSSPEAIIAHLLKQGGITISDVELVVLANPDILVAYANKAIDLAMQFEPNVNTAVERGLATRWPPGAASIIYGGEAQRAVLLFSEQFSKSTDAARRFMVGYIKGVRDYVDAFVKGKNKSEVVSIITKYADEKDPALYEKMGMAFLNPDGKIHVPSLKMDYTYFKEMGYYTGKLELESIIDSQFTDYAVQRLGPYQ